MKQTCSSGELDVRIYNRVCHALVGCMSQEAVLAAHTILNDMCNAVIQKNNVTPMPTSYMFNTLITAYGQLGNPDKAEKLFNEMKQLAYETGADGLRPTAISYSALVWAFAKVGDSFQTEVIANKILEELEIGNISFAELEETAIWDGVLVAWAQSGHTDATVYISKWIQRLIKYGEEHHVPEMVTTSTLNKLLECYSLMGTVEGAESTEALIEWMKNQDNAALKPDGDSYYCQILAWCKAGKPDQAEIALRRFCRRVHEQSLNGSAIDHRYFNIVIDAWSSSQDSRQAEKAMSVFILMESLNMKPNFVSYNSLILALSRTKQSDKCESVLKLFEKMKKQARDGDEFAKPTEYTYNAVIWSLGWSSESKKLEQAEELLHKCEQDEVQRNFRMYTSLMSGWMRHGRPEKVDALFEEMKDGYISGNEALKPTAETYTVRLQASQRIAMIEDLDGDEAVGAYWGEVNTTVHKGLGVDGAITNGLMRDLGDLAPDFQVLAAGIGPSHAFVHVVEIDGPVSLFGMRVEPGEFLHSDRHGAVVVPDDVLPELPQAIARMQASERLILEPARQPGFDYEAFEAAWAAFEKARV